MSFEQPQNEVSISSEKVAKVRALAQVEVMKDKGLSDKNAILVWRDQHLAEDFDYAFKIVSAHRPDLVEKFTQEHDQVIKDLEDTLDEIHSLRERVKLLFMQHYTGQQGAMPAELYYQWEENFNEYYTKAFDECVSQDIEILSKDFEFIAAKIFNMMAERLPNFQKPQAA
jgi:hypothetical protein